MRKRVLTSSLQQKTPARLHEKQGGFTVVDTLVCIVIFSLTVPLAVATIILVGKLNSAAVVAQEVDAAINSKASTLQSTPYADLSLGTHSFSGELTSGVPAPRSASYTVTKRSGSVEIKDIVIRVQYTQRGVSKTVQHKTSIGAASW